MQDLVPLFLFKLLVLNRRQSSAFLYTITNHTMRINDLLERLVDNTASEEDVRELLTLLNSGDQKTPVKEKVEQLWNEYRPGHPLPVTDWGKMYATIVDTPVINKSSKRRISFAKVAAAAILLYTIGMGAWFFYRKNPAPGPIAKQPQEIRFKNDVQPGSNGATLTLANGQQIILDSAHNGLLTTQGNTVVIKQNDQLSYQAGSAETATVSYNTITTPRGRQYPNLILADGSKVWLDAGSSIRFPTAFTGTERKVEITGQVWFDVVHNDKMPFRVMANGIEINDLGTVFNVNAYGDEEKTKVTLLSGTIRIQSITMKPGEQAQITKDGKINIASGIDTDEVMAWKNGVFQCEGADVASVMRQISRWYDVDIVYDRPITKRVSLLNVPRTVTMTNILKIMEMTGNVRFVIEGKKVTVFLL